ncbi:allantoicase [Pseudonocardia sp. C8]|uniref:allantoicase n=1 Tax=Pseudonocardia sp. C8 TaxID=2762759 RepID=UPI00351C7CA1
MSRLPRPIDLASRRLGGGVMAANDEHFGKKERLLDPSDPVSHAAHTGLTGDLYDGWETRRRRGPGDDWALVRLGAAGIVREIVVDTRHFRGQNPPSCTIEACAVEGFPSAESVLADDEVRWVPLVKQVPLLADDVNRLPVDSALRMTHVRLSIHPDGGVARLRVLGDVVPDPRRLHGMTFDLAAQANGGRVVACSDEFFGNPTNINAPTPQLRKEKGWESNRRRSGGHDHLVIELAAKGVVGIIDYDTTYYTGNSPESFSLEGCDATASDLRDPDAWFSLLARTEGRHDTPHWFSALPAPAVTHVRLNIYPDGGVSRLRLWGRPDGTGRSHLAHRWFNSLPEDHAAAVLRNLDVPAGIAARVVPGRPFPTPAETIAALRHADDGPGVGKLLELFEV